MPDMYYVGSGPINLPAATQLCTLALNLPAKPRVRLAYLGVSFNGTNAAAVPADVHVSRITNTPSGTAIPTGYGPNPLEPLAPGALTTALTASSASPGTWTTSPTEGAIVWDSYIPPTASIPLWYPLGQEIAGTVSGWIGVFITVPNGVTAKSSLYFAE